MNIKRIFPKLFVKTCNVEIYMQGGAVIVLDKVSSLDYSWYTQSGRVSKLIIGQLKSAKRKLEMGSIQLDMILAITTTKN